MEGKRLAALYKDGGYIDIYAMGLLLFDYPTITHPTIQNEDRHD